MTTGTATVKSVFVMLVATELGWLSAIAAAKASSPFSTSKPAPSRPVGCHHVRRVLHPRAAKHRANTIHAMFHCETAYSLCVVILLLTRFEISNLSLVVVDPCVDPSCRRELMRNEPRF